MLAVAVGLVAIYAVGPAETVSSDLGRLYADAGIMLLTGSGLVVVWLLISTFLTVLGVLVLRSASATSATSAVVAVICGVIGVIVLGSAVAAFGVGLSMYLVAEEGGYAPPSGAPSTAAGVLAGVGVALLVVAAVAGIVARSGRRRRAAARHH